MTSEKRTSKTAKILYRPWGLVASLARWPDRAARSSSRSGSDSTLRAPTTRPSRCESEYRLRKILIAAAVQGAIFTVVRALINRGGARVFERWTGEWPGD